MKKKEFCVLGIMSGTSIDGLDFSLIKTDGMQNVNIVKNKYYKFNKKIRDEISDLINFFCLEKKFFRNEKYYKTELNFINFVVKKISIFLFSYYNKNKTIK